MGVPITRLNQIAYNHQTASKSTDAQLVSPLRDRAQPRDPLFPPVGVEFFRSAGGTELARSRRDTITLEFLGRQVERLLAEIAGMRDDLRVQGAICTRPDAMMGQMLTI